MRWYRVAAIAAVAFGCSTPAPVGAQFNSQVIQQRDGSLATAGRQLRCGTVRNALDPDLPNLGLAVPDERLLIMNPDLLRYEPDVVRVFVYYHECGHHHVGASELGADCWAVRRGVTEGWFKKDSLADICRSFGGGRGSATHPPAGRRCSSLDRCFASASAAQAAKQQTALTTPPPPPTRPSSSGPQLVSAPKLIRSGILR